MSAYFLEVIFNLFEKTLASVKFLLLKENDVEGSDINIKHYAFNFHYYNLKNVLKV